MWLVFWTLWCVVGVAVAYWMPGFSYFTLMPAMAAALLGLVPIGFTARCVGTVVLSSVVMLPLVNLLPVAMGPAAAVIFHPAFVLLWLPLLPLWAAVEPEGEKTQVAQAATADTPSYAR